jgi:hypothetical protein
MARGRVTIRHHPGPPASERWLSELRGYVFSCKNCGEPVAPTVKQVIMGFPCCGYTPQGDEAVRLINAAKIRDEDGYMAGLR